MLMGHASGCPPRILQNGKHQSDDSMSFRGNAIGGLMPVQACWVCKAQIRDTDMGLAGLQDSRPDKIHEHSHDCIAGCRPANNCLQHNTLLQMYQVVPALPGHKQDSSCFEPLQHASSSSFLSSDLLLAMQLARPLSICPRQRARPMCRPLPLPFGPGMSYKT